MRESGLKCKNVMIKKYAYTSLPMRESGLKFYLNDNILGIASSLPMRESGLKFLIVLLNHSKPGLSLCGRVDWNCHLTNPLIQRLSLSLCGRVDWNSSRYCLCININSLSLCGRVDWNNSINTWDLPLTVSPYAGEWIEMLVYIWMFSVNESLPMRESGLKWSKFDL